MNLSYSFYDSENEDKMNDYMHNMAQNINNQFMDNYESDTDDVSIKIPQYNVQGTYQNNYGSEKKKSKSVKFDTKPTEIGPIYSSCNKCDQYEKMILRCIKRLKHLEQNKDNSKPDTLFTKDNMIIFLFALVIVLLFEIILMYFRK